MNPDKLLYISKSKKSLFENCPRAFKYSYVDELPQLENPYSTVGTDIHEFIDRFFEVISAQENGEIFGLSSLTYHPNTPYKKNVVRFEIERWRTIRQAEFDESYFKPVEKEKKYVTESPKLIGVVDRLHKCCRGDPFAHKVEEFKDGDAVIVENKTGIPTSEKCMGYEQDLLYYKILTEISLPEIGEVKWGAIYFPYNNYVHTLKLEDDKCRNLAVGIKKVREGIQSCLETGLWPAKPSSDSCRWCSYKKVCNCVCYG